MTIRTLDEANAALMPYAAHSPHQNHRDFGLQQVREFMAVLGDPQDTLRIVHIAGTSGKTSTAYYMAALLAAAGKKTGLTVSPHVDGVNERVQINGAALPEAVFGQELAEFLGIIRHANIYPSYFVLLYAFAMWVFARRGVEYAVVETGIGGLHDATNVSTASDKVCIITDIGFDHQNILGDTLEKIAAQKAGIIHEGNSVFMYKQGSEVMAAIRHRVSKYQAELHVLDEASQRRTWQDDLIDMAEYQTRNWLLAYGAYRYLGKRDGLEHLTSKVLRQTQTVNVPGRADIRELNGKTLVIDGAHNAQKMTALIDSLHKLYPGVKPAVLISVKDDKDYKDLVPLLAEFAASVITTAFDATQDSRIRSTDPEVLARAFRGAGMADVTDVPDQHAAFERLLASPERLCLVTGSFYLLGQIRNNEHLV